MRRRSRKFPQRSWTSILGKSRCATAIRPYAPPARAPTRLMLDVGLAVASGGECLAGIKCEAGAVLYLGLEDNERRLQSRMTRLMGFAAEWPADFHYAVQWPRANAGGL